MWWKAALDQLTKTIVLREDTAAAFSFLKLLKFLLSEDMAFLKPPHDGAKRHNLQKRIFLQGRIWSNA